MMSIPVPVRPFNPFVKESASVFSKLPLPEAEAFDVTDFQKKYEYRILEIGAGVGWHGIAYAKSHPNTGYIGIERTTEKATKAFQRIASHRRKGELLRNLYYTQADATLWVAHHLPIAYLDKVLLFYPNLELKRPNKRFFRAPFFRFLLSRMNPKYEIELATNSKPYSDEAKTFAEDHWNLESSLQIIQKISHPNFKPRTHFEKKYFDRNQKLFLTTFRPRATL